MLNEFVDKEWSQYNQINLTVLLSGSWFILLFVLLIHFLSIVVLSGVCLMKNGFVLKPFNICC